MPSFEGSVEQQDTKGWTPVMWSSSNAYSQLVKQLIQRGANVNHMGQAKSGSGTTMALHECAAMRGEGGQPESAYFETAWLLMCAGASPFAERSDGKVPIEVAAMMGNMRMKVFLETCSLFRGTLALPVPQTFGSKVKNRYCTIQPRFPFGNAAPTLWMVCYRNQNEGQAVCRIPLSNARVVVEGPQDSSNGIIIIPSCGKSLKGVTVKSHTSNSSIVEVRAIGSAAMPGWKTLRTLADVCKAAAVAVSCRNLDQLCAAALRQATRQMNVPGMATPLTAPEGTPRSAGAALVGDAALGAKADPLGAPKAGPMTDSAKDFSAEDMTLPPAPSMNSVTSLGLESVPEPGTPTSSRGGGGGGRRTSGIGRLFSTFRRSSVAPKSRYASPVLDSQQSIGRMSTASGGEKARKAGLWSGIKKSIGAKPSMSSMHSITEQSGGGLTAEDIGALSQPIPDKFWSRIGRKMSSQRGARPAAAPERAPENWFHNDDAAPGGPQQPTRSRRSFTYDDLDELMHPDKLPVGGQGGIAAGSAAGGSRAVDHRRQTADGIQSRAASNGTVAFILEEPIVPTQEMVPTGPRRSFSFDDYDDIVTGASRKARGHREGFATQMAGPAPPAAYGGQPVRQAAGLPGARSHPQGGLQEPGPTGMPPAGMPPQRRSQPQMRNLPGFPAAASPAAGVRPYAGPSSMPRRSFSLHDIDDMLKPAAPPKPRREQQNVETTVQDDLEAWRQHHRPPQRAPAPAPVAAATPPAASAAGPPSARRKGPAIDPYSHGGYQGAPAPEWRPYRPPSSASASSASGNAAGVPMRLPQGAARGLPHPQAAGVQQTQSPGAGVRLPAQAPTPRQGQPKIAAPPAARQQQLLPVSRKTSNDGSLGHTGGRSTDEFTPPELAHLASLRALETETISTASGRGDDRGDDRGSGGRPSQDLGGHEASASTCSQEAAAAAASAEPLAPEREQRASEKAQLAHEREQRVPEKAQLAPEREQRVPEKAQLAPEREQRVPEKAQLAPEREQRVPEKAQLAPEREQQAAETVQQPVRLTEVSTPARAPEAPTAAVQEALPPLKLPTVRVSPAVPAVLFQGTRLPKILTPPQRIAREGADLPEIPTERTSES